MNAWTIIVATLGGLLLGLFFFGGLWWTVQRIPTASHPAALLMGSLVLRMGVALAGFYALLQLHWQAALLALVVFTLTRIWLRYRLGDARIKRESTP